MAYLVDANTIIYVVGSQYPELTQRILATPVGEIQLSTIVFAELALGSANGLAPSMKVLDRLANQMPLVSFDEAAARAYAALPFKRARFDRLLAAHAPPTMPR